ncbi:putative metallopeptidase (plasmid) [Sinorhizobium medicae]|uniref:putative metallopeptidase n=1 Tax=Sinorhizobium medicae TaxID=110321 RepID=UPI002AF6C0F6|nr:putative metallopeptidase [Sinorhizobium medicae]WQO87909.1 putative metallopeptidase [Sinorhizobium medicae]
MTGRTDWLIGAPGFEATTSDLALQRECQLPAFIPAEDMLEWIKATFIDPSSPLHNEEHAHLAHAEIGFFWTVVENSRKGRRIIGQCEEGKPQGAMANGPAPEQRCR